MTFAKTLASVAALMATAAAVQAQEANPALIFDLGGKFDRSFNQASYEGAERFKTETGIGYEEFELQNDAQREQALVEPAVRVDLGDDFLSRVATLRQAERALEPRFLRVHGVLDVRAGRGGCGFDAQDVAHDDARRSRAGGDERAPQIGGQRRSRVESESARAGDGQLGDGTRTHRTKPVYVERPGG